MNDCVKRYCYFINRSVIERERKQVKQKQQSQPDHEGRTKHAQSSVMEVAPPQRTTIPGKAAR